MCMYLIPWEDGSGEFFGFLVMVWQKSLLSTLYYRMASQSVSHIILSLSDA